ncbi:hypothetical protein [Rossellomorea marisflavi]|uniref:hypothetical protein n=1 Tax=Rossellomorea marisflavi TaxID=189381 RepID=UPI001EE25249|nr:hypothetical protein [Rossellomorea marisflavi]UKS67704.1 hypothetical protein K6T23_22125 [Rossellomorea marisflavi]
MKSELDGELYEHLKTLEWSLEVFGKIAVSLERSLENIIRMIIQINREQIEDAEDLPDDFFKKEMQEEFEELKKFLLRNKVIVKKLAAKVGVDIEEGSVEVTTPNNLETLLQQNNLLLQDLIADLVNELEVLADEYKIIKENSTAEQIVGLVALLEELVDKSFDVSALLETHFGWDLEVDLEIEDIKKMFVQEEIPKHLRSSSRLDPERGR